MIFFGLELSSWLNRPRALTLENCAEIVEIEVDPANGTVIDGKYTASIRVNKAVHDFEITFILNIGIFYRRNVWYTSHIFLLQHMQVAQSVE